MEQHTMTTISKKEQNSKFQRIGVVDLSDFPYDISKSALYKWAKAGKYKEAFKRIGGSVCVNLRLLHLLIEEDNRN
jgi:hypothetical protein